MDATRCPDACLHPSCIEASLPPLEPRPVSSDHRLTLQVRDIIVQGLKVRAGSELTPAVIAERAANLAVQLRAAFDIRRVGS